MPILQYQLQNNTFIVNLTENNSDSEEYSGSVAWFVINVILVTVTICGNSLTICAILCTKKLSAIIANRFVFSLAVSDLFVGLTIPYHMTFFLVDDFGDDKLNCLLRFVLVSFACSSSVSNILAIATDRYVAIVYPLHYTGWMTRKSSLWLTVFCWSLSFTIAAVPAVWNEWRANVRCEISEIIPNYYLNFVLCPMFILIWIVMLLLYSRICREATGHARRIGNNGVNLRDSKSFQVMLTILGCFTICWLPYFVIAVYNRYRGPNKSSIYYEIAFNLAVANSGMNPIIYVWKNRNFRMAFLRVVRCRSGGCKSQQYITDHIPSKRNSLTNHDWCSTVICEKSNQANNK